MTPAVIETEAAAERMEALGRLAGGIAHDINNALMVISGYAELLAGQVGSDPDSQDAVQTITEAAARASVVTRQLLLFSRRQMVAQTDIPVGETVLSFADALQDRSPGHGRLCLDVDDAALVARIDAGHLQQIVATLVEWAREAASPDTVIRVTVQASDGPRGSDASGECAPAGPYVRVAVADSGRGLDARGCAHVFEPFFSLDGSGKGAGLAMAVVYGIVKAAGGYLTAESAIDRGTTIAVYLPLRAPMTSTASQRHTVGQS